MSKETLRTTKSETAKSETTKSKEVQPKEKEPEKAPEGFVFATDEEIKEKEQLIKEFEQAKQDKSIEGLRKQRDILVKLEHLAETRRKRIAREKGETILGETFETLNLPEQYESQKNILEKVGILETLSSGELGIKGIDKKEYPFPKYEDILERIEEKGEILKTKIEQGFNQLLIVPFGMRLNDLIEKYGQVILKHYQEGKLLATKEKPSDPDEKLELNENTPIWIWEEYYNADTEGKLVYFPKQFSKTNHQGKTKIELLKKELCSGYNIILIEDLPNIPRKGKGKTIGNRKQIEIGQSPKEYLEMLKKDKQYLNEQGMTPEDQITYAITYLEKTNQVIDEWTTGSGFCQLNSWFSDYGCVPEAFWVCSSHRAFLGGRDPGSRDVDSGVRTAVRV